MYVNFLAVLSNKHEVPFENTKACQATPWDHLDRINIFFRFEEIDPECLGTEH
jgi:hypothetical protein